MCTFYVNKRIYIYCKMSEALLNFCAGLYEHKQTTKQTTKQLKLKHNPYHNLARIHSSASSSYQLTWLIWRKLLKSQSTDHSQKHLQKEGSSCPIHIMCYGLTISFPFSLTLQAYCSYLHYYTWTNTLLLTSFLTLTSFLQYSLL